MKVDVLPKIMYRINVVFFRNSRTFFMELKPKTVKILKFLGIQINKKLYSERTQQYHTNIKINNKLTKLKQYDTDIKKRYTDQ